MTTRAHVAPVSATHLPVVGQRRRWRLPFSPWHLLLAPLALVFAAPLVWLLLSSVMSNAEINRFPPSLWPSGIDFSGYRYVLENALFLRWFSNSLIVSVVTVAANLVFGSLGGYAFARMRFRGSKAMLGLMMATMAVPFQLTMIPTFLVMKKLGLIDSLGALIGPNLVTPVGIFMLRQFFRALPVELEEAATIDGASRLGVLVKVVLPLSKPILATLAVVTFLWTWNDYLWPLIAISSPDNMTLQLGLASFQGNHVTNWPVLMAATMLSQLPMLIAFFFAQRHFVRSLAFSGLKG
jgi:multiple sugar transport system permease protein